MLFNRLSLFVAAYLFACVLLPGCSSPQRVGITITCEKVYGTQLPVACVSMRLDVENTHRDPIWVILSTNSIEHQISEPVEMQSLRAHNCISAGVEFAAGDITTTSGQLFIIQVRGRSRQVTGGITATLWLSDEDEDGEIDPEICKVVLARRVRFDDVQARASLDSGDKRALDVHIRDWREDCGMGLDKGYDPPSLIRIVDREDRDVALRDFDERLEQLK